MLLGVGSPAIDLLSIIKLIGWQISFRWVKHLSAWYPSRQDLFRPTNKIKMIISLSSTIYLGKHLKSSRKRNNLLLIDRPKLNEFKTKKLLRHANKRKSNMIRRRNKILKTYFLERHKRRVKRIYRQSSRNSILKPNKMRLK